MFSRSFKRVGLHYTAFRNAIREDSRQTTPSRGVTPRKKFAAQANVESRANGEPAPARPLRSAATDRKRAVRHSSFLIQHSWTARGAYCDWTRVDFPDGFGFGGDGPHSECLFMTFDLLFWEISILWGFWTTASTPGEQVDYSRCCGPARFRE